MHGTLADLVEPFKSLCLKLNNRLIESGLPLVLFETKRSFKRQAELYSKGRNEAGVVVEPRDVVTKASSGESPHNWGLAADFILDVNHAYWDKWHDKPDGPWDDGKGHKTTKPNVINVWHQFGELVKEMNLEWGGTWKFRDLPHVQLPNWKDLRPLNYKQVVKKEMEK